MSLLTKSVQLNLLTNKGQHSRVPTSQHGAVYSGDRQEAAFLRPFLTSRHVESPAGQQSVIHPLHQQGTVSPFTSKVQFTFLSSRVQFTILTSSGEHSSFFLM